MKMRNGPRTTRNRDETRAIHRRRVDRDTRIVTWIVAWFVTRSCCARAGNGATAWSLTGDSAFWRDVRPGARRAYHSSASGTAPIPSGRGLFCPFLATAAQAEGDPGALHSSLRDGVPGLRGPLEFHSIAGRGARRCDPPHQLHGGYGAAF